MNLGKDTRQHPRPVPGLFPLTDVMRTPSRPRDPLFERGRDARKRRVEARAQARNDSDNGACDASSDETVFDRGRSGFVAKEISGECTHLTRSLCDWNCP